MKTAMLLHEWLLAISAEQWPGYRDAYLQAQQAMPALGFDARAERPVPGPQGGVAIVPVMGALSRRGNPWTDMLGWTTYEGLAGTLRTLAADRSVARIVLRVDSPGGTVFGVEDAAQAVADAAKRKPVVAIADGLMASAAYWIASSADEIIAVPGAEVGSIGVIAVHFDESGALEKAGVVATELTAGAYKGEGSPFRPLSDGDRAALDERIEAQYQLFTARVARGRTNLERGRKVTVEQVRSGFGEGRVLPAEKAKALGLIDKVARMGDVLDAAMTELTTTARISAMDADLRLRARLLALGG